MKKKLIVLVIFALTLTGCAGKTINISEVPEGEITPPVTTTPPPPENVENPNIPEIPPEDIENPGTELFIPEQPDETDNNTTIDAPPADDNSIVQTARALIGIEFTNGGSSPSEGFDNSGFIYYVLRENGYVNSPRGLQEQSAMGNKIDSITELRAGDLVFFSENSERAQFGGIYVGDGVMVSCRMEGETVNEFNIMVNYYIDNFFVGVRVL